MPLYNCFSNKVCNNIDIPVNIKDYTVQPKKDANGNIIYRKDPDTGETSNEPELVSTYTTINKKHVFYSKDPKYVIYSIPIKFFKQYTIALDCNKGIELCCGFYDSYLHELPDKLLLNEAQLSVPPVDMSQFLTDNSYIRYSGLSFNNPILWKGINYETFSRIVENCVEEGKPKSTKSLTTSGIDALRKAYKERLLKHEDDLKLFIKMPINAKTSIVVLEGDYCDFNNAKYMTETVTVYYHGVYQERINGELTDTQINIKEADQIRWVKKQNHSVTNYETRLYAANPRGGGFIVTELPEVEDRPFRPISPLQLLMFNTGTNYPFSDRLIEYLTGNVITEWDENADNIRRAQKVIELNNNKLELKGAWEGKMRNILYDYMMGGKPTSTSFGFETVHDILGYVDKDVEKVYTAWTFENCRDGEGKLIPLVGKIQEFNEDGTPKVDENGNYVYTKGRLYKKVFPLLESVTDPKEKMRHVSDHSLLVEGDQFLLTVKARPGSADTVPLFKQKYVPVTNIQNVDIYGEEE
jgi:hypothetical protein